MRGSKEDSKNDDDIKQPRDEQKPPIRHPLTVSREELQSRSSDLIPRQSAETGAENLSDKLSLQSSSSSSAGTAKDGTLQKESNKRLINQQKDQLQQQTRIACTPPTRACTSPTGHSPVANPCDMAIYIPRTTRTRKSRSKSQQERRKALKSKSDSRLLRADMIEISVKSTLSSFKPLRLGIRKSTSIRALKNYIQSRTGITSVNMALVFGDKELKDDSATLLSIGMDSKSVIWVVIKPISGNNDREELASLLRMSQSLSTLRHIIRSMPSVDMDCGKKTSPEYTETELFISKEKEHELMRQRMKVLKERKRKKGPKSALLRNQTAIDQHNKKFTSAESSKSTTSSYSTESDKGSETTSKTSIEVNKQRSSDSEPNSSGVLSDSNGNLVDVSPVAPNVITYDPVPITQRELSLFFDPPESLEVLKFINNEFFEPATNEEQLLKIRQQIRNTRCGTCRIKLPIALREMRCLCDRVFCRRHRNPQDHRCSIDQQAVDRDRLKKTLPKLIVEEPKSKSKE